MLDEMIPGLKPLESARMIFPDASITASLPVIKSRISFRPFIDYLKNKRSTVTGTKERLYNFLINKFESEPSLSQPIEDLGVLNKHAEFMELLTTSLFPVVGDEEKHNFALAAPYQFSVFYYSDNFRKLFFDNEEQHLLLPDGIPTMQLKAFQCAVVYDHVLEKFYGMKLNENPELVYPIIDPKTGIKRYYRIRYDRRFIDIHLKGKLPPIQDCGVCMNTFRILDLEKQMATMPLDLFEMEGFAVWVAEDVTIAESIESIKKILLRASDYDNSSIDDLKKTVKALVGMENVDIGLMPFIKINDQFILDEQSAKHSLVARQWLDNSPESCKKFRMFVDFLTERSEPTPISNVNEEMVNFAPF